MINFPTSSENNGPLHDSVIQHQQSERERSEEMNPKLVRGSTAFLQAQTHICKHIFNFVSSMSLKCAVQLNIPDIINAHNRPMTLPILVSALGLPHSKTSHVHRLMRMLVHTGFFAKTPVDNDSPDQGYVLTNSSRFLLRGSATDLSPFVLSMLHPDLVRPWDVLADSFKSDKTTAFEISHGMGIWEFQKQNTEFRQLFNDAMASDSTMVSLVVKDCRDVFEGLDSIVDVGGGTGTTMKILSQEFPSLKCFVLDLPHVVADLPSSPNLEFVGGDMFVSIPSADAFLVKVNKPFDFTQLVMHSIGDEECVKILKKCKEAMSSGAKRGKVIIIDIVVDEDGAEEPDLTEPKLYFDMLMTVVATGRERGEKEWEQLFLAAGFRSYKITPIFGLRSLIEVFP